MDYPLDRLSRRLLTNRERIVFLLSRRGYDPDRDYIAPYHLSQDGIAKALEMRKNNVSRELSDLKEKELVEERKARVKGFDRRRKVYLLAEKGKEVKKDLEDELRDKTVTVETKEGERSDATIKEALEILDEDGKDAEPFHVEEWMRKKDVLNVDTFSVPSRLYEGAEARSGEKDHAEVLTHIPQRMEIYGREEEIEELEKRLEEKRPPFLVIEGIAGIGKTVLGRKILDGLRGERDLFWYSFHRWEDLSTFYEKVNEFLKRSAGKEHDLEGSAAQIAKELVDGLEGSRAVLFFDDCENMPSELDPFLEMMMREKRRGTGMGAVFMTRESLGFYDVRDEMQEHIFRVKLGPIKKRHAMKMLDAAEKKEDIDIDEVYEKTKGHPLYLELFRNTLDKESRMKDFLEKEIYSNLTEEEKKLIQRLSIFWRPVKKGLILDENDAEVLIALKKDNLVRETENGRVDTHEILKDFFYDNTSLKKKRELHEFAAQRLKETYRRDIEEEKHVALEVLYHLGKARRTERALEMMKDLSREISDLPRRLREEILESIPEKGLSKVQLGKYYSIKGDIYLNSKRWEKAVKCYNKAIESSERTESLRERLGKAQMELKRWDQTLETHKKNMKRYKEKDDLEGEIREHLSLGTVYRKKEDFEYARKHYEKARSLMRSLDRVEEVQPILYNNLGMLYLSMKDYSKSEEMFKKALSSGGEKSIVHENLSRLYEEMGEIERCLDHLDKAVDLKKSRGDDREMIELLVKRSDHYRKLKNFEKTIDDLQKALTLEEKRNSKFWIFGGENASGLKAKVHEKMAEVYREKGEMERCLSHRDEAIQQYERLNDNQNQIRQKLLKGFDLSDEGELEKALEVLSEVETVSENLNNQEGVTAARLEKARISKKKGEYAEAKRSLRKLIKDAEERADEKAVQEAGRILESLKNL